MSTAIREANRRKDAQRFECILDVICRRQESSHHAERGNFTNIHMRTLKAQCGRNACRLMEILVQSGIVECNNRFRIGEYSRSYRLAEQYRDIKCLIRHGDVYRRYREHRWTRNKDYFEGVVANMDVLKFDTVGAMQHIMQEGLRRQEKARTEKERLAAIEWQKIQAKSVQAIARRHWRVSKDDQGRVHTNFTNLWSPLRDFIKAPDGSRMVSIDIKNSQPFILAIILKELSIGVTPERLHELTSIMYHAAVTGRKPIRCDSSLPAWQNDMFVPAAFSRDELWLKCQDILQDVQKDLSSSQVEVQTMLETSQAGRFYDEFANTPEKAHKLITDRTAFKGDVFAVLYGDPKHKTEGTDLWDQRYPAAFNAVRKLKSIHYSILPKMMQAIESAAILGKTARDMLQEPCGIITIHDSYLVPEKRAKEYAEKLKTAFLEGSGIEVEVKQRERQGMAKPANVPLSLMFTVSVDKRVKPERRQQKQPIHKARPPPEGCFIKTVASFQGSNRLSTLRLRPCGRFLRQCFIKTVG